MDLEDAAGAVTDRGGVVRERGSIGGAHLANEHAGAGDELREPEPVANFNQFAATPDHLTPAAQRADREHQCGGTVVDDHHVAGIGECVAHCIKRTPSTACAGAVAKVVLDVHICGCSDQGLSRSDGERGATQVGMQNGAGGVKHWSKCGGAGGEMAHDVIDDLLRRERRGTHAFLRRMHSRANDAAPQPSLRLHEAGIPEQHISRRDVAARVAVHQLPSIDEWRRRTGIEPA